MQIENFDYYMEILWETVTFEFVFKFLIVYFFVIWIALIVWVIKDISIRTNSLIFQLLSVLIILCGTPLGIFIYLLIRPRRTLYDKYYEEIEENLDIINEIIEERKNKLNLEISEPITEDIVGLEDSQGEIKSVIVISDEDKKDK